MTTQDYEQEMIAMLKEPLGNVRVWHPSLKRINGASIPEIMRYEMHYTAWAAYEPKLVNSKADNFTDRMRAYSEERFKAIESAITARGKV